MDKKTLQQALYLHNQWDDLNRCIRALNEYRVPTMDDPLGAGEIPFDVLKYIDRNAAAKGLLSLAIDASAEIRKKLTDMGIDLG